MALWDQLKQNVSQLAGSLKTEVAKFKNNDFASAAMAICALIAAADGSISPTERQKTAGFIVSNDTLKVFNASELKQKFDHFCSKLESDYDFGKVEAIQAISKLRGKPDQARAAIQVGVIIGGADGKFDEHEKKALREACNAVGINPGDFDL
jgi:tellurite resistance protein TerB